MTNRTAALLAHLAALKTDAEFDGDMPADAAVTNLSHAIDEARAIIEASRPTREQLALARWSIRETRSFGLVCWGWSAPPEDGGENHRRQDWTEADAFEDARQAFERRVARGRRLIAIMDGEAG